MALEVQHLGFFRHGDDGLGLLLQAVPRRRTQPLEQLLFLVHQAVGPLEHRVIALVCVLLEFGQAAGDHHAAAADVGHRAVVQRQRQLLADQVVAAREDHDEFVAADAVHRAVLEDVADHVEGLADVFVARLVAQGVVDLLQPVHVADHHREGLRLPGVDGLVDLLFAVQIGKLALGPGHGVLEGRLPGGVALLHGLVLPPPHGQVVDQHRAQGHDEQAGDHQCIDDVCPVDLGQLVLHELRLADIRGGVRSAGIVFLHRAYGVVRGLLVNAPGPDHGHEHHQRQQHDPHDDGLAEAAGMVPLDDAAEVEDAYDRPHHEQYVGLRLQHRVAEQVREQQVQAEHQHDREADQTCDALPALLELARGLVGRGGHEAVEHRRAQRGHVHDPADGRPADEGDHGAHRRHQQHGVGRDVPVVELREPLRQYAVPGRGVEQPAQRPQVADQAGQHQRQQRGHQHGHAEITQVVAGGVERRQALDAGIAVQVADVIQPAAAVGGIGRYAQQRDEYVQRRGGQHRYDQYAVQPVAPEFEFLDRVGDALKAYERPGGDERDLHRLGEAAPVRQKGRRPGSVAPRRDTPRTQTPKTGIRI